MKENEINAAIMEACGWKYHPSSEWRYGKENEYWTKEGEAVTRYTPFEYTESLDLMHEAEKMLSVSSGEYDEQDGYTQILCGVNPLTERTHIANTYGAIHATALEKATAFLKAIGKWKTEA